MYAENTEEERMSIIDKLKELVGKNPDQVKGGIDRAGDMFDQRTGGKYAQHVDKGQQQAKDFLDRQSPQNPQSPRQEPPQQP
ncbi:MAG TPA: antitoxin [Nocardia sp.]|nr:antitoxin [Nocardia sp.]